MDLEGALNSLGCEDTPVIGDRTVIIVITDTSATSATSATNATSATKPHKLSWVNLLLDTDHLLG
jgi:hypothetical protein